MNLIELHDQILIDHLSGHEVGHAHTADNLEVFPWSMRDSWMTHQNWLKVTRTYLDPEALTAFLDGETDMLNSRAVQGRGSGKTAYRQFGSCLIGWTLGNDNTLYAHSRTSYLGYLLPLDLCISWHLARGVGAERVTLFLDSSQLHEYKSYPWWLKQPGRFPMPAMISRNLSRVSRLDHAGLSYEEGDRFSQRRRFRQRYHTELFPSGYGDQFGGTGMVQIPHHDAADLRFDHLIGPGS